MAGLVPAIHAGPWRDAGRGARVGIRHQALSVVAWMAGTSPAMTRGEVFVVRRLFCNHYAGMRGGSVYIMTNRPNGTLYVGVTSNLSQRVWQHREGVVEGFTSRYRLDRLVYCEHHEDIRAAIQRERNVKHWKRAWKIRLILDLNPEWRDLYGELI